MSELHRTETALVKALRTIRGLWPAMTVRMSGASDATASTDVVTALDRLVSLRHEVTLHLNGWARIVIEDRGTQHGIPDGADTVGLCEFLERHAQWLSGHECAEAMLGEVEDDANEVRNVALPRRREWLAIGDCPVTVADAAGNAVTCGGRVRAYPDRQFIRCASCGTEDTLGWWMSQILPEGSDIGTADTVITFVVSRTFRPITHEQLRQWATRGFVQRHGRDVRGRTLYSGRAVLAYASEGIRELSEAS